jgi:hypothetical protein
MTAEHIKSELRSRVEVPVWVISLLVPMMITILIAVVASVKVNATQMGSLNTSVSIINNRLDRIEQNIFNLSNNKDNVK